MARDVPKWISNIKRKKKRERWKQWWLRPWTIPGSALRAVGFKKALRDHGLYTPNFRISETVSKPDGCGCRSDQSPYPQRTQKLMVKCERVRHDIGDVGFGFASVWRNSCHESCIGGANGYHPRGQACDPLKPGSVTADEWNAAWYRHFGRGGIGTGCNTKIVQHADTGPTRRWCYAGR